MHFYYFFLLLLVVLSVYSESPHHAKPPDFLDPIRDTVCPNSSSTQLGILAPVLPQNEVFGYESLNDNLKLVLLTRAFKQNSHPKMSVVYRGTFISLP